jgi:predicted house-cleaning noncanonical NTP pyrophosphatase (MazG superfamily)
MRPVQIDENIVCEPVTYQASDNIFLENTLFNLQSEMHHIREELSHMRDMFKNISQAVAAINFAQEESNDKREWKKIAMTLLEKI